MSGLLEIPAGLSNYAATSAHGDSSMTAKYMLSGRGKGTWQDFNPLRQTASTYPRSQLQLP